MVDELLEAWRINNRINHLENWARDLAKGVKTFASKEEPGAKELARALAESGEFIERYIGKAAAGEAGLKGFKKGLVVAISYLISHDSHHRGSILLTLKECGHKVDQDSRYAIWDWDRR